MGVGGAGEGRLEAVGERIPETEAEGEREGEGLSWGEGEGLS